MRSLVIIAVIALSACATSRAEKITVAELEQILATQLGSSQPVRHAADSPEEIADIPGSDLLQQHQADDGTIQRIAGADLSQRLSTTTMFRLIWKYRLPPAMQLALEQLSDRTALLSLPPNEQPNLPAPDGSTQKSTLGAAQSWVVSELSHLPDFIATQTTTRFDDTPAPLKYWRNADGPGMHRVGSVQRQISFRDGKEVAVGLEGASDTRSQVLPLESHGEFGTEAAVVLMDMQSGTVSFSHWEQTMAGVAAVYAYSVPTEASHYEVVDKCKPNGSSRDTPAYHGTLALDPNTGAIFRMTLEADSKPGDPISHVASVIEYGPVVLGHHRSICPLRSLAFMVQETTACPHGDRKVDKPISMINQTIFSNYHRFGSSSNIIFNQAENGEGSAQRSMPSKPEGSLETRPPVRPSPGQKKRP